MNAMGEACARWIELSDREAVGDALSAEEKAFAREHVTSCTACRAEADIWKTMESLLDDPHERDRAGDEKPAVPVVAPRRARGLTGARVLALSFAVAAVAAVVAFVDGRVARDEPPVPVVAAVPKDAPAVLTVTGGAVEIDGQRGVVGQKLERGAVMVAREGSACLAVLPAVRACIVRGTVLRVADLGTDGRLELLAGKVAIELDPLPSGSSFGISTRAGSAIAVGTAFSVEVPPDDAPIVTRVLQGVVLVRASNGTEQRVSAHEKTSMRDTTPSALSPADEGRDRALLVAPHDDEQTAPVPIDAGVHAGTAKSAAELLAAARVRAARGDRPAAIGAYRELFERHGGSVEAHTALIPWGELQLSPLADPRGALSSFDRYLVRGGPLEQEASFGRIRALRALGRTDDERAAIEAFVLRFPDGSLTASLRTRLRAMEER